MTETQDSVSATSRPFQADVARLLELVVHSVYSDRDIFVRELISNAADACEKLRFETTAAGAAAPSAPARIVITIDKAARTLAFEDNGIGMNSVDLDSALGIIANSGTRAFLEQIEGRQGKADGLIGRFGVGFYSAFMVADKVDVASRRAGEDAAWLWSSQGKGAYTIAPTTDAPAHGARVVLHLKPDADDYLEAWKLESIVRDHSAGVPVPIDLVEGDKEARRISEGAALWARPRAQIAPEQYAEFYRTMSGHFDEPALTIHWRAEGRHEFDALAFAPTTRPFDLFHPTRKGHGRLYVRRVLVSEDADLLPPWLRFVTVLIDSADIPLNVSREIVQKSPILAAIRKAVTGRVLQELTKLAESDPEKYAAFWKEFGAVLKEGLYEDPERRDALFALARFKTARHPEGGITLKDYVANLRENQTAIYYLTGADAGDLARSPHLEAFRARGVDVLLLADPVDSFWVTNALGFDGKPFKSASQGKLDIQAIALEEPAAAPPAHELNADDAAALALMKDKLADHVSDVRASDRLQDSAACLVAADQAIDRTLARMLGQAGQMGAETKPVLEVNLAHPLARALVAAREEGDAFQQVAELTLGLAQIADGELPAAPADFARRLSQWLARGLGERDGER